MPNDTTKATKQKVITKRELVIRISKNTDTPAFVTKEIILAFMNETLEELAKGNTLEFRDVGVFKTKITAKRTARNPRTNEKVIVESHGKVQFKPGRIMKKRVGEITR